jgi:cold shock CspA family protein
VGGIEQQGPAPIRSGRGRGTVQHVYPERGFGFIRCTEGAADDVGRDFFFHTTGLDDGLTMRELLPGSLVEFECREVPRGKRAEHVQRAL